LITVFLIEWHRVLAGIQLDFLEPRGTRAILQFTEDGLAYAVTALRPINRHVTDLTASSGDRMQPADTDQFSCVVPSCQMNGFTLELVFLGPGWLIPWLTQDFPAHGVVRFKLRFASWRPNQHTAWNADNSLTISPRQVTLVAFCKISYRDVHRLRDDRVPHRPPVLKHRIFVRFLISSDQRFLNFCPGYRASNLAFQILNYR
jgi:hypothetical protein